MSGKIKTADGILGADVLIWLIVLEREIEWQILPIKVTEKD